MTYVKDDRVSDEMKIKVDVYRNLHKDVWSVRNRETGRVISHETMVHIKDASFVVQPAGRKKVITEKRKNVHAFVRGHLSSRTSVHSQWRLVTYNPYKADHFCYKDTGDKVTSADEVLLDENGVWVPS